MKQCHSNEYFIAEIPIALDGSGPETDPEKVCSIIYEIWDDIFNTVRTFDTEEEAMRALQNFKKERK